MAPHNICIAPNKPLAEPTRFFSTDESAKTKTFANVNPLPNPNIKQADASVKGKLINGTSDKNIRAIDKKHQEDPKSANLFMPTLFEYLLLITFPMI